MQPWIFPQELPEHAHHYLIADWPVIAEWIESLHTSIGQVEHWSWFQLYADFQQMFPGRGPWFNQKKLQWKSRDTMPDEVFVRRTRWFTTFIMNLAKQLDIQMPAEYRSPTSHVVHYWSNTLPVQVPKLRPKETDKWLQTWRPIYTTSKQLRLIA